MEKGFALGVALGFVAMVGIYFASRARIINEAGDALARRVNAGTLPIVGGSIPPEVGALAGEAFKDGLNRALP